MFMLGFVHRSRSDFERKEQILVFDRADRFRSMCRGGMWLYERAPDFVLTGLGLEPGDVLAASFVCYT